MVIAVVDWMHRPPFGQMYVYNEPAIRGWLREHVGDGAEDHWRSMLDQNFARAFIETVPYVITEEPW